ncbi:hypothetical protein HIM_03391 [Hirsutella minnesotensis 3608]|uniref:Uncharacterized protein n=1 Tax=Hirsutella minnesotensis 3608 TaxID=1043627 RepID=A0A0F7ZQD7_9HYPO|nr:hypothetical protein HIM_03391 [Hirsutella minnesotensis 3608]
MQPSVIFALASAAGLVAAADRDGLRPGLLADAERILSGAADAAHLDRRDANSCDKARASMMPMLGAQMAKNPELMQKLREYGKEHPSVLAPEACLKMPDITGSLGPEATSFYNALMSDVRPMLSSVVKECQTESTFLQEMATVPCGSAMMSLAAATQAPSALATPSSPVPSLNGTMTAKPTSLRTQSLANPAHSQIVASTQTQRGAAPRETGLGVAIMAAAGLAAAVIN